MRRYRQLDETGLRPCGRPAWRFSTCSLLFAIASSSYVAPSALNPTIQPAVVPELGHSGKITAIAMSADGSLVLTGSDDDAAILWDVKSGLELRRFEGHTDRVGSAALTHDAKLAIT